MRTDRPDTLPSASPLSQDVWPARWGDESTGRKGVIVLESEPLDGLYGIFLGPNHRWRPGSREYADANALAVAQNVRGAFQFRPEDGGGMLFVPRRDDWPTDPRIDGPEPSEVFRFVSARPKPQSTDNAISVDRVLLQRTWFALYLPPNDPPQKLVVLLPGLFGMPGWYLEPLVQSFLDRGYAVLRMLALPSRFLGTAVLANAPGEQLSIPRGFASIVDDRLAEAAYAAEAARNHIEESHPELAGVPAALVGMSGGALVSPAVVARDSSRYQAVVLIAGGANFADIGAFSVFTDALLRVGIRRSTPDQVDDDAGSPELDAIEQAEGFSRLLTRDTRTYLEYAALDPENLAPRLRDRPVLVIHAKRDVIVPAFTGDRLWERLGRPERWVYPVGHGALFLVLPFGRGAVVDWIDEHLHPMTPVPASQPADSAR